MTRHINALEVVTLIDQIESRPCLWDKTNENFKNKIVRRQAWKQVCCFLQENYLQMDYDNRVQIKNTIISRWTNVRDAFMKSLKNKNDKFPQRKYIYHDHLLFLIPSAERSNMSYLNFGNLTCVDHKIKCEEPLNPPLESNPLSEDDSDNEDLQQTVNKRKRLANKNVSLEIKGAQEERSMNDDESFFASLVPTLGTFSQEEKIDFRIEVLNIIKKIKSDREMN